MKGVLILPRRRRASWAVVDVTAKASERIDKRAAARAAAASAASRSCQMVPAPAQPLCVCVCVCVCRRPFNGLKQVEAKPKMSMSLAARSSVARDFIGYSHGPASAVLLLEARPFRHTKQSKAKRSGAPRDIGLLGQAVCCFFRSSGLIRSSDLILSFGRHRKLNQSACSTAVSPSISPFHVRCNQALGLCVARSLAPEVTSRPSWRQSASRAGQSGGSDGADPGRHDWVAIASSSDGTVRRVWLKRTSPHSPCVRSRQAGTRGSRVTVVTEPFNKNLTHRAVR